MSTLYLNVNKEEIMVTTRSQNYVDYLALISTPISSEVITMHHYVAILVISTVDSYVSNIIMNIYFVCNSI